ncbi:MAG TPA: decarboxylating 6-phosphogluconate dehydrogenase [Candidatus Thermoplasmatota archaeon]|nr:decarboxylating 6-phosphogluconate dehydrogenase [Candidatus Thermoplasmatota archaeon]
MRFGVVGLGRIGASLALQALEKGHEVVGLNRSPEPTRRLAREGVTATFTYEDLAAALAPPRVVLVYVPHGDAVESVLGALSGVLEAGDVVVDGGNSHWRESRRRHADLAARGLRFVDAGTSGGVEGARTGACFMVGGEGDAVRVVAPLLRDLAVPGGFVHAGGPGAGHYVKLIHNAVEFGMVQALAEGVELLYRSEYDLDLADVMACWSNGSVVRGWLVDLMEEALRDEPRFTETLTAGVSDTKEGKWYARHVLEQEAFAPVLVLSEMMFYRYRDPDSVAAKAVALLRHGYGAHPLPRAADRRAEAAPRREP